MNFASPEPLNVALMPGLNARAMALLAGPGGGKTTALAEFFNAPKSIRVLAIDPAGALGEILAQRDDVSVVALPRDWKSRPNLLAKIVSLVRPQGSRVCCTIPPTAYADAGEFVEQLCVALMESQVMDIMLVFEECQRYLGQNREGISYAALATIEMGRNWRWGRIMATQRPAELIKGALGRCDTVFLGRLRTPRDLEAADDMLEINIPDPHERKAVLRQLSNFAAGQFLLSEPTHLPTVNQ